MTRSTHSKSRKPRNQKQISQKRGTRKLQRGGGNWYDYFTFLKSNKAESAPSDGQSEEEKKGDALKTELTSTLKTLTNLLPKVKLCAVEEVKRETPLVPAESNTISELPQPVLEKPMGGGMSNRSNRRSNSRGRGPRAPPKKRSKKGMVVDPRKTGAIIF
jgi:hypothetical protein